MDGFIVPETIPQDLLLIQEYVGIPSPTLVSVKTFPQSKVGQLEPDDISSTDEEDEEEERQGASEEEIAAGLAVDPNTDDEIQNKPLSEPSDSTSESDSDSDHESLQSTRRAPRKEPLEELQDDEDEAVPSAPSGSYFQTKNEVADAQIAIPDVKEVGPDEVLEKVGEVVNIVNNMAIVRGLSSSNLNRGSERALDSDTLLVFEDGKIMGYIYETFGPTNQPLYQIKFNSAFPLDAEKIRVGRDVYHIPARSRFVFISHLKALKGSDASNVHDEEPADDEIEFSDDEAEASHRSRLKRKRGDSRARSVASSRHSTPNPTFMRDQELSDEFFTNNAYDEHGPYDIDYSVSGPSVSRPAPIPYDDPYGDYAAPEVVETELCPPANPQSFRSPDSVGRERGRWDGQGKGHGRDRNRGGRHGRDRRGRRDPGHGRGRGGGINRQEGERSSQSPKNSSEPSGLPRSMSPTSLAIARATGQISYPNSQQSQTIQQQPHSPSYSEVMHSSWGYPGQMPISSDQSPRQHFEFLQQTLQSQQSFMPSAPFIQPHINPRFASAFGIGLQSQSQSLVSTSQTNSTQNHMLGQQQYMGLSVASVSPSQPSTADLTSNWTNEWTASSHERSSRSVTDSNCKNTPT